MPEVFSSFGSWGRGGLWSLALVVVTLVGCARNVDLGASLRIDGASVAIADGVATVRVDGRVMGDVTVLVCGEALRAPVAFRETGSDGAWVSASDASVKRVYPRVRGGLPEGLVPGSSCVVRLQRDGRVLDRQVDEDPVSVRVPAAVPGAPTGLVVTPSDVSVVVGFVEGASNGSEIVNHAYAVEEAPVGSGEGGGAWRALSPSDAVPPVRVSGLEPGTTYVLALRAVNGVGAGVASEGVSVTTLSLPEAPGTVQVSPGDGTVTVDFEPGGGGGREVTYEVSLDGGATWRAVEGREGPPFVIDGLENGSTYRVAVRAVTPGGAGAASEVVAVTPTAPDAPGSPEAPEAEEDDAPPANGGADGSGATPSFTRMAGGGSHTVAVDGAGSAWAWGEGSWGQLGNGTSGSGVGSAVPVRVNEAWGANASITDVAAGNQHALAIDGDGDVWAWGNNSDEQLGDGTETLRSAPVHVSALDAVTVTQVAAGEQHSLALDAAGRVWTWGNDYYGQLGQGSRYNDAAVPVSVTDAWGPGVPITTISAGQFFSVALDASGAVWAWGQNQYGQLGIGVSGTSETVSATPVRVSDVEWVAAGVSIVDVEAGIDHVLALDDAGNVWAWGRNAKVELIPNTDTKTVVDSAVPAAFDALNHVSVTDVAAGSEHSVARDADGHVWAWGNSGSSNFYGEIGDGQSGGGLGNYAEPVNPVLSVSVSDVAAGREFTLARAQDGALWTWGHNNDGQLGHGVFGGKVATPAQVDVP